MVVNKAYLKGRINEARECIKEIERIVSKPYVNLTSDEKYSLRYQIIVLVEAIGSACLHITMEDLNHESESYRDCIRYLEKSGIATRVEDIVKVIGLRNLLIHRYWVIDDLKIYESAKKDFQRIEDFLRAVESRYELR
ncbi:MAG: DUF86 domain-containing protein [Thermoproteota archaeon]